MVILQLPCQEETFEEGKTRSKQNHNSKVAFCPPHQVTRLAEGMQFVAPHAS